MNVLDILNQAHDTMTVRQVFGEPIERDGLTVIPVAKIRGGAGGGSGGDDQQSTGAGGGFGVLATPAGVYVIKDGQVRWEPALDINQLVLGSQIVGIVLLILLRPLIRAWLKRSSIIKS